MAALESERSGLSGPSDCRECLHEAVEGCHLAFKLMFPYQFTRGVLMPNVGAPGTHLRAWSLLAATKAEAMQLLVVEMASDLDSDGERARQRQVSQVTEMRAIAARLLNDLFPDASLHDPIWRFRVTRMSEFDEAMQIADAAAALAQQLEALVARCPCAALPLDPSGLR